MWDFNSIMNEYVTVQIGILLVQIRIPVSTSRNWNSDLYWI